jgi:peroxiredoxin
MRHLLSWLLAFTLLCGCDSGSGSGPDDDDGTPDSKTQEPETPATVQCTKTATCEWGEWCTEKKCTVPEGAGNTAFDFTRTDESPGSATYKQQVTLSDNHGKVILLYFSTTTCAACVADVKVYESMIKQLEFKGFVNAATMITVILPMGGSAMADFTSGLQFPVVLDEVGVGIAQHYSAGKDTVVLIDGAGYVRASWPSLEVRGAAKDKSTLNETLTELVQEVI